MARLIAMKCPKCDASIQLDPDQRVAFCSYCGTQLLFDNEREYTLNNNSTVDLNVTYHEIDEAAIKRAEADMRRSDVKMAQVAAAVKETEIAHDYKKDTYNSYITQQQIRTKWVLRFAWLLAVIGTLCLIIAFSNIFFSDERNFFIGFIAYFVLMGAAGCFATYYKDSGDTPTSPDSIKLTLDLSYVKGKNAFAIESQLRGLGFTNIKMIPLEDLVLRNREGRISSVTIAGEDSSSSKKWYDKNTPIVITYHSTKSKRK